MSDPGAYALSEDDSERIFRNRIVPKELGGGRSQDKPTVVFVVAQHGSGKTATTSGIQQLLPR